MSNIKIYPWKFDPNYKPSFEDIFHDYRGLKHPIEFKTEYKVLHTFNSDSLKMEQIKLIPPETDELYFMNLIMIHKKKNLILPKLNAVNQFK